MLELAGALEVWARTRDLVVGSASVRHVSGTVSDAGTYWEGGLVVSFGTHFHGRAGQRHERPVSLEVGEHEVAPFLSDLIGAGSASALPACSLCPVGE